MTGGTNPGLEDLLRERLHEVDELDPPDPDFQFRALRTGRDRLKRRQGWQRGLVGAAAAVVVGALAVPAIGRLSTTSGGASSAGVAAQQDRSAVSGSSGGAATKSAPEAAQNGGQPGPVPPSSVGVVVPYAGSTPVAWDSPEAARTVDSARAALAGRYPADFTALSVDRSTTPSRLVVHVTRFDDAVLRDLVALLAVDAPVGYALAPFSAQGCARTLTTVEDDRARLSAQGYTLGSTRCTDDGRAVVQVTNLVTAEQIRVLEVRYGDAVRVEQSTTTPS